MPYTWEQIAFTAIILMLGGLLQSTVGFAYGLFAIPLLMWVDIPVEEVLVIVLLSTFIQGAIGMRLLKEPLPWKAVSIAASIRIAFMIVGLLLLQFIVDFDKELMQVIIGGILILSVILLWTLPERKSDHVQFMLFYTLIAPASGIIGGMIGMGGPPLLLWTLSQPWEQRKIRAFLFCMFMTTIPIQIPLIIIMFGSQVWWGVLLGIVCLPPIYLGSQIGIGLGNRLNRDQFKKFVYIILLLLGVKSVYNYLSVVA